MRHRRADLAEVLSEASKELAVELRKAPGYLDWLSFGLRRRRRSAPSPDDQRKIDELMTSGLPPAVREDRLNALRDSLRRAHEADWRRARNEAQGWLNLLALYRKRREFIRTLEPIPRAAEIASLVAEAVRRPARKQSRQERAEQRARTKRLRAIAEDERRHREMWGWQNGAFIGSAGEADDDGYRPGKRRWLDCGCSDEDVAQLELLAASNRCTGFRIVQGTTPGQLRHEMRRGSRHATKYRAITPFLKSEVERFHANGGGEAEARRQIIEYIDARIVDENRQERKARDRVRN